MLTVLARLSDKQRLTRAVVVVLGKVFIARPAILAWYTVTFKFYTHAHIRRRPQKRDRSSKN